MSKFLLLLRFLSLANAFVSVAMSSYDSNPPAEAPVIRKLSKQSDAVSPCEAPQNDGTKHHVTDEGRSILRHERTSIEPKDEQVLGSDGRVHSLKQHHHSSFDRSIVAGVVILGGLATTFLVAVFCYIKASGRSKAETIA